MTELKRPDRFEEPHHFFIGMYYSLSGFAGIFFADHTWQLIICLIVITGGLWNMIDDVYQHTARRYNVNYLSPIHRWTVSWAVRTPILILNLAWTAFLIWMIK